MENYKERQEGKISIKEGGALREEIYKKARELFPNSTFSGQLDPKTSSLAIFNDKSEMTRQSAVGVVKKFLERAGGDMIDKRDKGSVKEFENYLNSMF